MYAKQCKIEIRVITVDFRLSLCIAVEMFFEPYNFTIFSSNMNISAKRYVLKCITSPLNISEEKMLIKCKKKNSKKHQNHFFTVFMK